MKLAWRTLIGVWIAVVAIAVLVGVKLARQGSEPTPGKLVVTAGEAEESTPSAAEAELATAERQEPAAAAAPPTPEGRPAAARPAGGGQTQRSRGAGLLTAPMDYLRTTTIVVPRSAEGKLLKASMENELKQFKAIHGRHPKSLQELVEWRGEKLPDPPPGLKYMYVPKRGVVVFVPSG